MKVCKKCGVEKSSEEFSKNCQQRDGLRSYCKSCVKQINAVYTSDNKEKISEREKVDRKRNPEKYRRWSKKYEIKNKSEIAAYKKKYASENRNSINVRYKNWLNANPEKLKTKQDFGRKFRDAYKKNNTHLFRYYTAKRRAALLHATPPWQTDEDRRYIADLYKSAVTMSVFHEEEYHVDHIEPLIGKNSCGLHIPINLRIIPKKENLSKGNKLLTI